MHPVILFKDDGEEEQTEVDLSEVLVEPCSEGEPARLKTSLARAISKAIGRTKMVEEFDEVRSFLKTQKTQKQKGTRIKLKSMNSSLRSYRHIYWIGREN